MISVYTKYFENLDLSDTLPEDFLDMFETMLIQANGDVDRIMEFLEQYNDRFGFFNSPEDIKRFREQLEEMNLIVRENDRFKMTAKGKRWLRERIFKNFFKRLRMNNEGQHSNRFAGRSILGTPENRPYEPGDTFANIDYRSSIRNALKRRTDRIDMTYDDLEIKSSLSATNMATVLLIDISHSMILYGEDRITPAKKLAMALVELIKTKYPKDKLHVCVFGNDAWEIPLHQIEEMSVGPYHTNTLSGLLLAEKILKKYPVMDKQIIMVTDGKPTCLKEAGGYYKNSFGLDPHIINKVLKEAIQCRRQQIPISTFMLTKEPQLVEFVEEFTKLNSGRAFHVDLNNLSSSVMIDFVNNRKKRYK